MAVFVKTDTFETVQGIEYAHASVHNDIFVIASAYDTNVDIAAPKTYLHTASDTKESHVVFTVSLSESGFVHIYKSPTITSNGTEIIHTRLNLYDINTTIATTYEDPILADKGTLIWKGYIAAGVGGNAVGGSTRNGEEFVLPAGESLVVEIVPATDNETCGFAAEYYEAPKGVTGP